MKALLRDVICWVGVTASAGALVALSLYPTGSAVAQVRPSPAADTRFAAAHQALAVQYDGVVKQYCISCHNSKLKTGDVSFEGLDLNNLPAGAATWEKAVRKLRSGAMPPAGIPRPDVHTTAAMADWLESGLDADAARNLNPGRRSTLQRLNRAEYANAVRDIFGVDVDSSALLPPDDTGYGFDNIADVLSVSPMLTERYMSAARSISRVAVGDTTLRPATDTFKVSRNLRQDGRMGEDLPFGSRGGMSVRYYFPVDGDYYLKILPTTGARAIRALGPAEALEVRIDGEKVEIASAKPDADSNPPAAKPDAPPAKPEDSKADDGTPIERARRAQGAQGGRGAEDIEVKIHAKAGPAVITVSFVKKAMMYEGTLHTPFAVSTIDYATDPTVRPGIASIEIRGPYDVKGPGNSPSRDRIFVCHPKKPSEEARCAKQIISALQRRAYRRPVKNEDIQDAFELYSAARAEGGSFDAGIQAAVRRILVSPDFLFRAEYDPKRVKPGTAYRLTDVELASRLSFFLWSSVPDDELLTLAERGRLKDAKTLERQVRRMLADERSRALVVNFAGQWLLLRNLSLVQPDPYIFPTFDENLRDAYRREVELFVQSQIKEDRGVNDLLDSNYTFINEPLAKQYGIPNIYGDHFRRVTLSDDNRRGLLGKGGILTVTSYPNRTSPVIRGKWLLENIIGAPPPPPPPVVPTLDESSKGTQNLSVREKMELHRADPVCASCHKVMDPLGFALENFDAIGQWRTVNESGSPIDASGVLADGTPVQGPATLRKALMARPETFATTVTEKLMTYAMGRGVEYYDLPAVRGVVRASEPGGYRWSQLIVEIVKSTPFQMRMPPGPASQASLQPAPVQPASTQSAATPSK